MSKTYIPKVNELERKCFVIDASDKVLGKVATKAAIILRGKNKVTFTPHLDTGDNVVIINAAKVRVTGNKLKQKEYQRYSGYPSGQRRVSLEKMLDQSPTTVLRLAVNRMIPKGRLGNQVRGRLRVYAGDKHPHQAQKPVSIEI